MIYKEVTHIEGVPEEWKHTNDWDSHRELLWLCLEMVGRNIYFIEYGIGYGSTPLLLKHLDMLLSIENNSEWIDKIAGSYKKVYAEMLGGTYVGYTDEKKHLIYENEKIAEDWIISTWIFHNKPFIIFIDNAPATKRKDIIEKLKNEPTVMIVHDTEESAEYVYGMKEILSTFKYRLDYKPEGLPHTTAVSNFINVTEWV